MAVNRIILQPYIRSTLPVIPGGERIWSDNEFKKLEAALNSLRTYIEDLEKRISVLEAKAG